MFQIGDYIRISSLDFTQELSKIRLRMKLFSKSVYDWTGRALSEERDVMKRFFNGDVICVKDNSLSVELPKGTTPEDRERLVQAAFAQGALPMPDSAYDVFELDVKADPDSVACEFSGSTIKIAFSTTVRLKNRLERFSRDQLELGVTYVDARGADLFRVIQEMVLEPGSVDVFDGYGKKYVIKHSDDIELVKRKFLLANERLMELKVDAVLRIAIYLGPEEFSLRAEKLLSPFVEDIYEAGPLYKGLFLRDLRVDLKDVKVPEDVEAAIACADSIINAYRKCIDALNEVCVTPQKRVKCQVDTGWGILGIDVDARPSYFGNSAKNLGQTLSEELEKLIFVREFLKKEIQPLNMTKVSPERGLVEYVFARIQLDPLRYGESGYYVYKDLARTFIS